MELLAFLVIFSVLGTGLCDVWCYKCVSTHPGCGEPFDWRWYWSYTCPNPDDKCVKIIEKKGVDTLITRDCLSSIEGIRRDIPSDRYEGCRSAATDVKLGHYVFNDIHELNIKRNYFDNTTFCFCDFDYWCNDGRSIVGSLKITVAALITAYIISRRMVL